MINKDRIKLIEDRLQAAFSPTHLEVIDESDQHVGHAGHQGGGRHFAIVIAAPTLKNAPKVVLHRKVYALFDDLMPDTLHALRIKIVE